MYFDSMDPSMPAMPEPPRRDELWPMLVELLLNARGWWIGLCAELDLTAAQGHALRSLDPERPVPMSALADLLFCDASNVTGIVDKLEARGLISRQATDHDRRVKQLIVTDAGKKLRHELNARVLAPPRAVSALPDDVKAALVDVVRGVLAERAR
jgi:MarR family transcriptional regulator, organic hydroperoxide resistance regulator